MIKILERLEEERKTAYRTYETFENNVDMGRGFGLEKAIEIVQEVAKEYGNGWIPVETALPTEKGWYRVTCEDKEIWKEPIVRDLYYYPTLNSFIDNIRYSEHGCNDIMKYDWTKYVTAWKPLDAPYQKGE